MADHGSSLGRATFDLALSAMSGPRDGGCDRPQRTV